MKAVSNTTPLRYLIAIEQEHLLGQLFEKVFVPVAVHEELTDAKTPETVRRRVLALPAWFEVRGTRLAKSGARRDVRLQSAKWKLRHGDGSQKTVCAF